MVKAAATAALLAAVDFFTAPRVFAGVPSTNADVWNISPEETQGRTLLFINGSLIHERVIIENSRALVPLRVFAEALGAEVEWIPETMTAKVIDSQKIDLRIGDNVAALNGAAFMLPVAPRLVNSVTYVPLRFISEALGAAVAYSDGGGTAAERYLPRVKHIMVSRYGNCDKPLSAGEALAAVKAQIKSANEALTEDNKRFSINADRLAVSAENDRYYVVPVVWDFWVDKYTGEVYVFYNGANMSVTKFNPYAPGALAFAG